MCSNDAQPLLVQRALKLDEPLHSGSHTTSRDQTSLYSVSSLMSVQSEFERYNKTDHNPVSTLVVAISLFIFLF